MEIQFTKDIIEHLSEDGFPPMLIGEKGKKAKYVYKVDGEDRHYVIPDHGARQGQEIGAYGEEFKFLAEKGE